MTEEALCNILNEGGEELEKILGRMQKFNANISGSNAYFYKRRKELEALIQQEGLCSTWFTFSAADNHWLDLNKIIHGNRPCPSFANEYEKAKWRRKLVKDNPHIVDSYFSDRVREFLNVFHSKDGLEYSWFWYRVEYQSRGTAHIHGCLRLKNDPGIDNLSQTVLQGRISEMTLKMMNIIDDSYSNETINDDFIDKEAMVKLNQKEFLQELSDDEIATHMKNIEDGKKAHATVIAFHDWIFSSIHPNPPPDKDADKRTIQQEILHPSPTHPDICHPCSVDVRNLTSCANVNERVNNYCHTVNAVQRHLCNSYCDRNHAKRLRKIQELKEKGDEQSLKLIHDDPLVGIRIDCRFAFPKELSTNTYLKITQKVLEVDKVNVFNYSIDVLTKRNDKWLVGHPPHYLESWQGNLDYQLVVDYNKVFDYMTKYATKTEATTTKGVASMIRKILCKAKDDGLNVQTVLKRAMAKLLGERMMSKQETSHLILSLPLVMCSHRFTKINLNDDCNLLDVGDTITNRDDNEYSAENRNMTIQSIVTMYGKRMIRESWSSEKSYADNLSSLDAMNLRDFCSKFRIGQRGNLKNKIVVDKKPNFVAIFYPSKNSYPNSDDYHEYCMYNLIKFKPWIGEKESVYGGSENSKENIISLWHEHMESVTSNGHRMPNYLQVELDTYKQNKQILRESDSSDIVQHHDDGMVDNSQDDANNYDWIEALDNDELEYANNNDFDDVEEVNVQWNKNHDFSILQNDYDDDFSLEMIDQKYKEVMKSERLIFRRAVCSGTLNERQLCAHNLIIKALMLGENESVTDGGNDVSRLQLILGKGGCGKSYVLDSVVTTMKNMHNYNDDNYLVMAPTGKAASNVCGSTLHSNKEGLALPVKGSFKELLGERLTYLQRKHKNRLKLIFLDEFTMISQKMLYYTDRRLRQIMCVDKPFGGLVVVMFGDPGQLPPVGSNSLWIDICKDEDLYGFGLYKQFTDVVILEENNRLDKNDPDAVLFEQFLSRLRDGENTDEDFELLRTKCSYHTMGHDQWIEKGFEDNETINIYTRNKDVLAHNNRKILSVGNPIALVESENTGRGSSLSEDNFNGLASSMYVCVGAKVVLTKNYLQVGLSNGSTGIVTELFYDETKPAPGLPKLIFVDFGTEYAGDSFFPNNDSRKGWFPVYPVVNKCYTANRRGSDGYTENSRTMLPLKLCWAWTGWKVQGMTIPRSIVVHLDKTEADHGITYVMFSRVRKFSDIGIKDGIDKKRLCDVIRKQGKMKRRINEETRLKMLADATFNKYFR